MMKKLNKGSMKSLVAAFVVLSLTTISFTSCTKSDESLQTNQSEIESRRRPGGGSGVDNSIPQVTGLTVSVSGSNQINLTWNSVPNATSYWIYRNNYVPAIVTSTSYIDRAVSPGTTYTYAIAAVVNSTLGPKSASVTVTTP